MNDLSLRLTGHDGLLYFGCIHPDQPDWRQELDRIAAAGLRGIKLHPVYQGVDFDDVRYLRILERAGELGLIIVTHAGDDIGFPGVVRCSPATVSYTHLAMRSLVWLCWLSSSAPQWTRAMSTSGLCLWAAAITDSICAVATCV